MKRRTTILIGLCLALAATGGFCQTARNLGMGGAGIADTSDVGIGYFNPAGVAWVPLSAGSGGSQWGWGGGNWGWQAIGTIEASGDTNYKSAIVGAVAADAMKAGSSQGFSFSWADLGDADFGLSDWQATYGRGFGPSWAAGLGVRRVRAGVWGLTEAATAVDLGVVYKLAAEGATPVTIGVTLGNLLDAKDAGRSLSVGGAMPFALDGGAARGVVSLDVLDINHSDERTVNVGAEYWLRPDIALRAGSNDGDFTFGAGYKGGSWNLDVAFMNMGEGDRSYFIGGTIGLGR